MVLRQKHKILLCKFLPNTKYCVLNDDIHVGINKPTLNYAKGDAQDGNKDKKEKRRSS